MPDRTDRAAAGPWRTATVAAGGLALLWITVGATFAQVAARGDPGAVMRIWPMSAQARARTAETDLSTPPSPSMAAAIREQAGRALLREPISVTAARAAGLAAGLGGDDKAARRLLRYAESLSRHDLGTQVALIEFSVADGDVPQALRHYDIALRSGDAADQLLMPVLTRAARDPQVATGLRSLLAGRPPWRMRFVYSLLVDRPWPSDFAPLLISARLSPDDPQERDFLRRAIGGLVADGAVTDAARIYASATGARLSPGVRNGDFAHDDRLPPFDWDLADEANFAALKEPVDGTARGNVLSLIDDDGRRGVAARQLLLLAAGPHVLRLRAGAIPSRSGAAPTVTIACAGPSGRTIATVVLPPAPLSGTSLSRQVVVPAECLAQWLTVTTGSAGTPAGDARPWIARIAVVPG